MSYRQTGVIAAADIGRLTWAQPFADQSGHGRPAQGWAEVALVKKSMRP